MSKVGVASAPILHGSPEDNDAREWVEERDSRLNLTDTFLNSYHEPFDDYIAESWLPLPQLSPSWNNAVDPRNQWSPDESLIIKSFGASREEQQDDVLYADTQHVISPQPHNGPEYEFSKPSGTQNRSAYQPPVQAINQMPQQYGHAYHSQTPHTAHPQPNYDICGASSFQIDPNGYSDLQDFGVQFVHEQPTQSWSPPAEVVEWQKPSIDSNPQHVQLPNQHSLGLLLDWSVCDQSTILAASRNDSPSTAPVPKRKASKNSVAKSSKVETPRLSECVDVFENAPGALASVKRRKKLDAPVRKAAREVRKAGACHQCRFRKRTCSTGTPCASCLKSGNGLHEIRCQRESPFIARATHEYFAYSSTRRVISFDIKIPPASPNSTQETITIDGIGRISHTIQLPARWRALSEFSDEAQCTIMKTEDLKGKVSDQQDSSVLLLEDDELLGIQIEQWALEYTSKFVHAAGPQFYSTTIAQILGTVYVKKGLPEAALVGAMLRCASLSFVLRAGVKFTTSSTEPSTQFRTIQARIDTILYHRLQLAEKDLHQRLQRLIFRSAGCLAREQIYPVAVVLWQLLRFSTVATSHLSNIAQRFQSKASGPAAYQLQGLRLLLSTHMALFRSSNPLLLDMTDKFNQNLIGGDPRLIELAVEMRNVVLTLREKGSREMKGSITYRKEFFDMFRKVY